MSDAQATEGAGETESAEAGRTGGAGTTATEDEATEDEATEDEGTADEGTADEGARDESGGADAAEGGVAVATKPADRSADPEEERLEQVGEQIRHAAQTAEDAIGEPGQKFYESGNEQAEASDDQTIAPPG